MQDAGQEAPLLLLVAEVHDRRAQQPFAHDANPPRSAGARILLVEDHLLDERRAPAAVLSRPAEADPVVATKLLLPYPPLVEQLVLVAGAAPASNLREASVEPVGEPRPRVGAKPFLRGREVEIHRETRQPTSVNPEGIAVVTGASRGIGRAVAIELAARGFDTVATMRDPADGAGLEKMRVQRLDVTDPSSIDLPDGLRVLVNNAGTESDNLPVEVMPEPGWRALFETNVFGLVEVTKRAVPLMRAAGGGVICNITSSSTLAPVPFMAGYRATKAAVTAIGESLAAEVAQFGIRVVEIMPGPIETDMLAASDRPAPAIEHQPYRALAEKMWAGRQGVRSAYTPAPEAARRIVDAICDDEGPLRYGCDPLSEGMLAGWETTDNDKWVRGMLRSFS